MTDRYRLDYFKIHDGKYNIRLLADGVHHSCIWNGDINDLGNVLVSFMNEAYKQGLEDAKEVPN